jgi:Protein of unknown function (DUF3313)
MAGGMRFLCLLFLLLLTSCQTRTAQKWLKAKPAPVTPFLDHRAEMQPRRDRLPMHFVWITRDAAVQNRVADCTEIYIAPVEMRYLAPISKPLVRWEVEHGWIQPRPAEMAEALRNEFISAMMRSPRLRVVSRPTPKCVVLALAITQLSPTSVKGNAVKLAAKFTVGPLSGLLGVFTKGNIAIEGKLVLPDTQPPRSHLQFSDNEKDKMTFYSVRDFQPYAHAQVAMKEWASQFEEFTRTLGTHKVKESSFITLKPW